MNWDALTAIGTLSLALVTLLAIFKDAIPTPHITEVETLLKKTTQKDGKLEYHRLIVKSVKWSWNDCRPQLGRSVNNVALLTYESVPDNFIPVILSWTYWGNSTRDLSKGEPAYLNVICFNQKKNKYEFCWAKDVIKPDEKDEILKYYKPEFGNIRIEFYERKGGNIGDIKIAFDKKSQQFEVIK